MIKHRRLLSKIVYVLLATETISLALLWISYYLNLLVFAEISLICMVLAHAILCHKILSKNQESKISNKDSKNFNQYSTIPNQDSKNMSEDAKNQFRKYSACYSFYLLIAYIDSSNYLFLVSFLIYAGFELVFAKIFSTQQLKADVSRVLFNWNSLDICRVAITITWILMALLSMPQPHNLTWFFAIFNFMRGLTGFRAFNWTRFYVRLIFGSVMDIASFLIIFVYITVAFGVINYTSGNV